MKNKKNNWNLHNWNEIPYEKRNEIIAFYGLKRSQNTKVSSGALGSGFVEDDGIRENDLQPIAHMAIADITSLTPITAAAVSEPILEAVETKVEKVEVKPKRGRPKK